MELENNLILHTASTSKYSDFMPEFSFDVNDRAIPSLTTTSSGLTTETPKESSLSSYQGHSNTYYGMCCFSCPRHWIWLSMA
jgi:hypothetical protein